MSQDGMAAQRSAPGEPGQEDILTKARALLKFGEITLLQVLLTQNPELRARESIQVDVAYDEYRRAEEAGIAIDPEEFCKRYPAVERTIFEVVSLAELIKERPELLGSEEPIVWPVPGRTFLGFRLVRLLGSGSFARVYLAREKALGDRLVVVKVARNIWREAETLGKLEHPNIVPVFSVKRDIEARLTAICMPYLGSTTLEDVIRRCHKMGQPADRARRILEAAPAPEEDAPAAEPIDALLTRASFVDGAVHLVAQLADALAFVHAKSICHRDLKPSNVLVSPSGRPRLLDFNLAAAQETERGPFGGTLAYMSPEQLEVLMGRRRPAELDGRSDLFALAVLLYELLTGRLPHGAIPDGDRAEAFLERYRETPVPLRRRCPQASPALEQALMRCLALQREERPGTAREFAAALRATLGLRARARALWGRRPVLAWSLLLLLAASTVAGAGVLLNRPPLHERLYQLGLAAYQSGDFDQAIHHFSQAQEAGHDPVQALFARGRAYQQSGNYALAQELYLEAEQQATASRPSGKPDPRLMACRGYCYNRMGLHNQAASFSRKAIEAGQATAEVLNNLAYGYLRDPRGKEAEQAAELLDRALELNPGLQAAYHNRAFYRYNKWRSGQDPQPAISDVEKAFGLGPGSRDLYLCAARCYARGETPGVRVLECLRAAIALGTDPAAVGADIAFNLLRHEEQFQALVRQPKSPPTGPESPRLCDPVSAIPALD